MAGKRKADDDISGASQPPLGTTATPPDDDGDSPDLSLVLGLPGVGRRDTERRGEMTPPPLQLQLMRASGSATEHRMEVEPLVPQQRPTAGRSGEHDETAAAVASASRPVKDQASWTKRCLAFGADLRRPSQWNYNMPLPPSHWNYNMPPQQHLQSPQQYQMFLQGRTGPQVPPQHAIPGFVLPTLLVTGNAQQPQTAPASNQLASPGQMRQQHGRSIIRRDDAQQRSARMLEVIAARELQQPEKRQKLELEQATVSPPQLKLSLGPPGAAAQAQEQATMSARQEKLQLGQHAAAAAAQAPVPVNQSVAASRGLALRQPQCQRVVECPACRARPALVVLDPVCHVCLCMYCFRDPSKACPVCRPG